MARSKKSKTTTSKSGRRGSRKVSSSGGASRGRRVAKSAARKPARSTPKKSAAAKSKRTAAAARAKSARPAAKPTRTKPSRRPAVARPAKAKSPARPASAPVAKGTRSAAPILPPPPRPSRPKRSGARAVEAIVAPVPTPVPRRAAPTVKPLRITVKEKPAAAPAYVGPPMVLAEVRERLRAKKQEILALYLNDLRSGQESNDSPTEDIVDRANNAYSRELNFSISDAERTLLLQVEEALDRIEKGTYGACAHCGQPIARQRLDAIPWARHCIHCQELLEQGLLVEG